MLFFKNMFIVFFKLIAKNVFPEKKLFFIFNYFAVISRGGVLKDIFGLKDVLENTFSSPWP